MPNVDVANARLVPLHGSRGWVVRVPYAVAFVAATDEAKVNDLLSACEGASSSAEVLGRVVGRLSGAGEGWPAFGLVTSAESGLVVLVHGSASVKVTTADDKVDKVTADGEGRWLTRTIPEVAKVEFGEVESGTKINDLMDVRAGLLPAQGAVLVGSSRVVHAVAAAPVSSGASAASAPASSSSSAPASSSSAPASDHDQHHSHRGLETAAAAGAGAAVGGAAVHEASSHRSSTAAPDDATQAESAQSSGLAGSESASEAGAPSSSAVGDESAAGAGHHAAGVAGAAGAAGAVGAGAVYAGEHDHTGGHDHTGSGAAVPEGEEHVRVTGRYCARGHFNAPRDHWCRICGLALSDDPSDEVEGVRPPLGQLIWDNGEADLITTDTVVGRDPSSDGAVGAGHAVGLCPSGQSEGMSRIHAELRLVGWEVLISDRGSTNGTFLWDESQQAWERLEAGERRPLTIGSIVAFGERTATLESPVSD